MKVYFSISILTMFCLHSYMTTYHRGKHVKCTNHHSSNLLKSIFLELHSFLAKWIFLCLIQLLKLNFQIYRTSIHKPCWNSETLIFAFQIYFFAFRKIVRNGVKLSFEGSNWNILLFSELLLQTSIMVCCSQDIGLFRRCKGIRLAF